MHLIMVVAALSLLELGCGAGGFDPMKAAQKELQENNLDQAEKHGKQALAANPESRKAREFMADLQRRQSAKHLDLGDFEEAFRTQKAAALVEPARQQRAKDWLAAAKIAQMLSLREDIMECAAYAVEADPTSLDARLLLASSLDEKGNYKSAVRHYLYIWKATQENTSLGTRLATLYLLLKRYEDADVVYRAVLEKEPTNVQAALGLAEVVEHQSQIDEAGRIYKGLTKKHPNNGILMYRYSEFLERIGRSKAARRYQKRAEKLLPGVKRRRMRKLR